MIRTINHIPTIQIINNILLRVKKVIGHSFKFYEKPYLRGMKTFKTLLPPKIENKQNFKTFK